MRIRVNAGLYALYWSSLNWNVSLYWCRELMQFYWVFRLMPGLKVDPPLWLLKRTGGGQHPYTHTTKDRYCPKWHIRTYLTNPVLVQVCPNNMSNIVSSLIYTVLCPNLTAQSQVAFCVWRNLLMQCFPIRDPGFITRCLKGQCSLKLHCNAASQGSKWNGSYLAKRSSFSTKI